jgi:hypothetical protein
MPAYIHDPIKGYVKVPPILSKGQTCLGLLISGIIFLLILYFVPPIAGTYLVNLFYPNPHEFPIPLERYRTVSLIFLLIAFIFSFVIYRIYSKLLSKYLKSKR